MVLILITPFLVANIYFELFFLIASLHLTMSSIIPFYSWLEHLTIQKTGQNADLVAFCSRPVVQLQGGKVNVAAMWSSKVRSFFLGAHHFM